MKQNSYNSDIKGKLYLIPTPIGNLDDITLRALNILKEVDIVFAEDTRETFNLLKYYNINKKIESCHKYSEMKNKEKILKILKEGKTIGFVSDRGTPLISDPGNFVVNEVIKENIPVIALPGATALIPALNMSGLDNERFLFYGFLNNKKNAAKNELNRLKDVEYTMIFYESPRRLKTTLELMLEAFGNRKISIVREISKLHEEIIRDSIENVTKIIDDIKGEIVIVVEKEKNNKLETISTNYIELVKEMQEAGYSKKDAIKEVSLKYNISKNKLYEECKEL
ncbi:ribosomal RNA small subunit methyltransferase I [Clostridium sp. CAG:1000]|nr:ribosomal RNA small subunit methyltransferase I [Clostridium sp. CAG:1000]